MRLKHIFALTGAVVLCLQWLRHCGLNLPAPWQPVLPGAAILGAAFLLSWAAELAQLEIPQALSLACVALVAVLPEYAVDIYFAWTGGKDPSYVAYAAANMAGGNRLLIGAGWFSVVFAYWIKTGRKAISLEPARRLELFALIAATLYSFVIPLKKTLSLFDCLCLLLIFAAYIVRAARSHMVEPDLEGGPAELLAGFAAGPRRAATALLFVLAALTICKAAGPFAEGLLRAGRQLGVDEFILVQWLAPLASEAPEFIVAVLFALRGKPGAGIGTLLSSKVNQWTLLVGMLPLAYAVSSGGPHAMHLDGRQVSELLLTSAQSIFAVILLCDLEFSLRDGAVIFALFLSQLVLTGAAVRCGFAGLYLAMSAGLLAGRASLREGFVAALREGGRNVFQRRPS